MTDRLLNSREVEELLGVTDRTLRRYRYARKIVFIQLGYRTIRYRREDVERFLMSSTKDTARRGDAKGLREAGLRQADRNHEPVLLRPRLQERRQGRKDAPQTPAQTEALAQARVDHSARQEGGDADREGGLRSRTGGGH